MGLRFSLLLTGLAILLLQNHAFAEEPRAPAGSEASPPPKPPLGPEAAPGPSIRPPVVRQQVAAQLPQSWLGTGQSVTVLLRVEVKVDGSVGAVDSDPDSDLALRDAAVQAVKAWLFEPATRDGVPVAARITVPFTFPATPAPETEASSDASAGPTTAEPQPAATLQASAVNPSAVNANTVSRDNASEKATTAASSGNASVDNIPNNSTEEVLVSGQRPEDQERRSASDYHFHHDVLTAAPHADGADVLSVVPGLFLTRAEGAAVAHRYVLRGFDSEHGQDIEFHVAGIPINVPAHIHGQGYADLGFLIAETVDQLRVVEGVHDPRQGDFAVAGSIDVGLGVQKRGTSLSVAYGSFNSARATGVWAPPEQLPDSFGAVSLERSDGFGVNRSSTAGNLILQQGFGSDDYRYTVTGIFHAARSGLAGVVRADDVAAGKVDFYGSYPQPTAEGQNAFGARALLGVNLEYRGAAGDSGELGLWCGLDDFRLRENYTGFLQRSQTLEGVSGRGDLIEQRNDVKSIGASGWYRRAPLRLAESFLLSVELGGASRFDQTEQAQNLLDAAVRSQTWDRRVDAAISGLELGAFADLDLHVYERFRLRAGLRGDALGYDVNDRLGNFAPLSRAQDQYIVGYRRSAFGIAAGPRTSADFELLPGFTAHAAYGHGYRSPQPRLLEEGEQAPFTKVRSADVGLRFANALGHVSASLYQTNLSDDVAFDAEEGRMERVGSTRRRGAVVEVAVNPTKAIVGAFSCTYVDAELRSPPPATPDNPNPPFRLGQRLPFVPPLVVRADLAASHEVVDGIVGRLGAGFSALSPRPLPYGEYSPSVALVDAGLGATYKNFSISFEASNLLNSRYSALELTFPSNWHPDAARSRVPARHYVAGAPRTLMFRLEARL